MNAVAMFERAALDAHFQAACQRYARSNGSSHAIAAAALLAVGAPELLESAHAAWNCVAELPPTQARVEAARMLTAAIAKAKGEQS
ncbi:hypothetical protein [Bordetella bronchiseptica]|uniref:hypothetical protein n=1 Tax=Bordetella bronchiseptica TaxID=518 RepID=UPI0004613F80|nr:hypothetical protein [Bordetella bronchiseptica]KDC15344.1 hypothetical protein L542_2111 [Bordetella bronchiseptica F-1]KDC29297.1 hypothetical protein L504_2138 [Bordetella bronchiseptica F2]